MRHYTKTLLIALSITFAILPIYVLAQTTEASIEQMFFSAPAVTSTDALPLPKPGGQFQVGTRTYHWVWDEAEELTPSEIDRREVIAQFYYPAMPTTDRTPVAYVPQLSLLRRGLLTHGFPPFAEMSKQLARYAQVQTASWSDGSILKEGAPFPVVLISPGGNMSRHWHTALSQELASQGYVVAVISHPHSGLDMFPGGGFLASNMYWHPGDDVPADEVARRDKRLAERLAADVDVVLDGLERLANNTESDNIFAYFNLERIAIIGHSRGGSTVTAAGQSDPRIDACVIFDNIGLVEGMSATLQQPRLTVRASWPPDRIQQLTEVLSDSKGDAFDVVLRGANHFSFTDLPLIDPAGYPSENINPTDAHAAITQLTLAFLKRYLLEGEQEFPKSIDSLSDRVELRTF